MRVIKKSFDIKSTENNLLDYNTDNERSNMITVLENENNNNLMEYNKIVDNDQLNILYELCKSDQTYPEEIINNTVINIDKEIEEYNKLVNISNESKKEFVLIEGIINENYTFKDENEQKQNEGLLNEIKINNEDKKLDLTYNIADDGLDCLYVINVLKKEFLLLR